MQVRLLPLRPLWIFWAARGSPTCRRLCDCCRKSHPRILKDLRLDQRVQQLFQIMNTIFRDDPACMNRDLNIKTFNPKV